MSRSVKKGPFIEKSLYKKVIEMNKDSEGNLYLVIHSGSRNLGKQIAEYYQKKAIEYHENIKSGM